MKESEAMQSKNRAPPMYPHDIPRDRYMRDPNFRSLVDQMVSYILISESSPSEMREAAILASTIYEERRLRDGQYT